MSNRRISNDEGKIVDRLYRGCYRRVFPDVMRDLKRELRDCGSILDLGCGSSSPIGPISGSVYSVGVDRHRPSLEMSRREGIHNATVLMDAGDIGKVFGTGSFDCVLALDLIEHLEKEDGLRLMEDMMRTARRKVIILTPNGFRPQEAYSGNEWQVHRSGWSAVEMEGLGFRTIGVNGWRPLRGDKAALKYRPKLFCLALSDLTQLIVRNRPEWAYQILCVRDVKSTSS